MVDSVKIFNLDIFVPKNFRVFVNVVFAYAYTRRLKSYLLNGFDCYAIQNFLSFH